MKSANNIQYSTHVTIQYRVLYFHSSFYNTKFHITPVYYKQLHLDNAKITFFAFSKYEMY